MTKVLLIEDNEEMLDNTREILELADYEVTTAANGKDGLDLARKSLPDLIISDIMMPELDGYGVLSLLAKNPKTASIPFIFLTAKTDRQDLRKGMSMGADDYLTKPFQESELLEAVNARLEKSRILKEQFENSQEGLNHFINEAKTNEELQHLSANKETKVYKKKESIFWEDEYPKRAYLIHSGKVKTFKSNEEGKEYITGIHKPGDFIGYLGILQNTNYTESAAALEDSGLVRIPRDEFLDLVFHHKDVSYKFMQMLSNNLKETEEQLLSFAYDTVRKRVADTLLRLKDQYKESEEGYFTIPLSREELAGMVGTAKESVIRILSEFKEDGYIDMKGRKITLLDEKKLAVMGF